MDKLAFAEALVISLARYECFAEATPATAAVIAATNDAGSCNPHYIKQPHPPALAVDRSAYTGKMDLTRIRFDCHKYLFGSNLETRGAMNAAKPDPKGRFLAIFLCFCAKNGTIESLGSIIATLSGQKPTAT